MLEEVRKKELTHFVLITRDLNKGDWAYKPNRLKDAQGRMKPNLSITLAHPLLVHEAKMHCPTVQSVHVISLDEFAQIANSKLGFALPELLAALQFEDMEIPLAPQTISNEIATRELQDDDGKVDFLPQIFFMKSPTMIRSIKLLKSCASPISGSNAKLWNE